MSEHKNLTHGSVFWTLVKFALPVLLAMFLQALYGGVDMLIVGEFADTSGVSGVSTGGIITQAIQQVVTALSMGITIVIAEHIGAKRAHEAGKSIGAGIALFVLVAAFLTALLVGGAEVLCLAMQVPSDAFFASALYIRICGIGSVFIVAYNVLGAVFRGLGDSRTPLITVAIACLCNIGLDLLLVAVFNLGAAGAAIATVISQGLSVAISLIFIKKMKLPFTFSLKDIRFDKAIIARELKIGSPVALQEIIVSVSFIVIQAVANYIGLVESAGVGVSMKIVSFIMLMPSSYMQSMSAFVAQNVGANEVKRANKALFYGIITSLCFGAIIGFIAVFHGEWLAYIFNRDALVVLKSKEYLAGFGIDCVLTPFLFCLIGYFNGREKTLIVMIQGIIGAVVIRMPLVLIIGLAFKDLPLTFIGVCTPVSTVIQISYCIIAYFVSEKHKRKKLEESAGNA